MDKYISLHKTFEVEPTKDELHAKLLQLLSAVTQSDKNTTIRECMQYGHMLLTPEERNEHNELPKKPISANTSATKHLLFQHAELDDYQYTPDGLNVMRTLDLMRKVILEYSKSDSFFVNHGIHAGFASICKLSALETLGATIGGLGKSFLRLNDILLSSNLLDVSDYTI